MDEYQLDQRLRELTAAEQAFLATPGAMFHAEHHPVVNGAAKTASDGSFVLQDDYFISPEHNISIHRQHRFVGFPDHSHNFIELVYVYSGQCVQVINNNKVVLKEGEICLLDTNVVHSIEPASEGDIIVNCLMRTNYFNASLLSRLSGYGIITNFLIHAIYQSKDYNDYIVFHSGDSPKVRQWMTELMCEHYDRTICSDEMINCLVVLLFSELLRVYQIQTSRKPLSAQPKSNIADILRYIEQHYKQCTLASTADHFHFHPNYLSALLKKMTGKSFKQLIYEQKLNRAGQLLLNTDLTVDAISREIGYANISFFYKKFRELYGVSPAEFRQL